MTGDPLSAVDEAAAVLAGHPDESVRNVSLWLQGYPSDLLAHLGYANGVGYSARQAAALAKRDGLLRAVKLPSARLATELSRYRAGPWLRERTRVDNPYQAGDRKAAYFQILKIADRSLSARQIRRILRGGHQTSF
jgi:hypothetical protein